MNEAISDIIHTQATMADATDKLGQDSLGWALSHVRKFGDTDIFPCPFEYKCIHQQWNHVLGHLKDLDFSKHEVKTSLRLMVPKHSSGFRASTQLDPLDCILYTAAVFECASNIEAFRLPKKQKIACSYRLDINADGQLFPADNGWTDFHSRSLALCQQSSKKFVLTADLVDFYNQLSHHRIQNALQASSVDDNRSKSLERFLTNLTALHHSRGIPVGPSASILLAELCLADVDKYITRLDCSHTRYVDDFRIFCRSEKKAVKVLHDLSDYLYTAHRLSLQNDKTGIEDTNSFKTDKLRDPEEAESQQVETSIAELIETLQAAPYGDPISESDIDKSEISKITRDALKQLLAEVVNIVPLPIGFARYVLRKAARLRTRTILEDVIENLETLAPVLRDVINYCTTVCKNERVAETGSALVHLATQSKYRDVPFIHYWVIEGICKNPRFTNETRAFRIAETSDPLLKDRLSALVAREYKVIDWVRQRKENWQNSPPWGQRAIIWSSSILPSDERKHWLKLIKGYPDLLIETVAKSVD